MKLRKKCDRIFIFVFKSKSNFLQPEKVPNQNHWENMVTMGISMPDNPKAYIHSISIYHVIYASHDVSTVQKHMQG